MSASTGDDDLHLLVVGLDAGCRSVLEPLFDADVTPTLAALFERGTSGPLASQIPPWTASAWPSLYTGKNPGKHGIYDFLTFDGYDWDVVNASHVRARPIWELLDDYGYTSVVVNVPVTHPPGTFDGALIPGMTAPEDPKCHPDGLLKEVTLAAGDYRIYPQSGPEPPQSLASYERTIETRGAAFRFCCRRFDPDFAFLQFQLTDTVFHDRPGDSRAIEAVYGAVDQQLEQTLEATEPTNVLLVSDHGIGPVSGPEFRINEYLRARGDVTVTRGEEMPNWTRTWENELLFGAGDGHEVAWLERAMTLLANRGLTTQRVADLLDRIGLKATVGRHVPNGLLRAASERVDFPNSRVYMRSKSELGLRINLAGREPAGVVPPEAYNAVRDELIADLSALETPDGEPIFEAVEPRETYFTGPHLEQAPDIVTVPRGFETAVTTELGGDQFGEPLEPWNHRPTGIIAGTGPDLSRGSLASADASIFDVAPTICSLFDVPVDAAMDGRPLPIVEPAETVEYPAYDVGPISATDDTVVEKRLSDLGYL